MRRRSSIAFAVASTMALLGAWTADPPEPRFAQSPAPRAQEHGGGPEPSFQTQLIPRANAPMAHCSSIAALPGGERLAVWYSGSSQAGPDVSLFQSRYRDGQWLAARRIFDPGTVSSAERRLVTRVGNPVVFSDATGQLRLIFVTMPFGGWACSSLNESVSTDQGQTWTPPRRIVTRPLFNLGTLVRNPPLLLDDGGFALPVYHEMLVKYPELLRFDRTGTLLSKCRMGTDLDGLQPALSPINAKEAVAFLRDSRPGRRRILRQDTGDGGQSWTRPKALNLSNPDSAVAVGVLSDGTLILVYNPHPVGRRELVLDVSRDGFTWQRVTVLERDPGGDFSYPSLIVRGDTVDLTYTWQTQAIKHARFNEAWIRMKLAEPSSRQHPLPANW